MGSIWKLAAAAALGLGSLALAQGVGGEGSQPSLTGLQEMSREFSALYDRASDAMVHVKVTQTAASVLDPALKTEFDNWVRSNAPEQTGRGGRGGEGRGPRSGGGGGGRPDGMPGQGGFGRGGFGPGGNISNFVPRFLQQKANDLEKTNPDEASRIRALALRAELIRNGIQGELSAVVLDKDGHALLLVGLLREAHPGAFPVTLPDGGETTAQMIGANLANGITVIKLDKTHGLRPMALSHRRLIPGEMMVSISAGPGSVAIVMASGKVGSLIDERFVVPADRTGAFLFDTNGEIAGVVAGGIGGGWTGDRQAMPAARVQRDIDYIIKVGHDLEPRPLGLHYDQVERKLSSAQLAVVNSLLDGHRAVAITDVENGSLAEKAGLQVGDVLVSIDGRPWQEILQVQTDLVTRTGSVPVGIIRGDKAMTLQMPLDAMR